jgi:hypothetical protein
MTQEYKWRISDITEYAKREWPIGFDIEKQEWFRVSPKGEREYTVQNRETPLERIIRDRLEQENNAKS